MKSVSTPSEASSSPSRSGIVVSGMRTTGPLHLGHYFGVLVNWLELQKSRPAQSCYFFLADWHALTTHYEKSKDIQKYALEILAEWIACGIDPEKSHLYLQSDIPEILELYLILSMTTPVSWLERNPTYKEQQHHLQAQGQESTAQNQFVDTAGLGFLSYPVLQTADIAIVQGSLVPVGEDQLPHLELSREIVRRFKHIYKKDFFPEPKPLLTPTTRLPGTDGRKMSKSYGNTIDLSSKPAAITKAVKSMVTDPLKIRQGDPGRPDICNVYTYQKLFPELTQNSGLSIQEIETNCKSGALGCGSCKQALSEKLISFLGPIAEKRNELLSQPKQLEEILKSGQHTVKQKASSVMKEVRSTLGFRPPLE